MKDNDSHTNFHFLSEIAKENTYRLLFPDPKAGMAIIWLYEKLQSEAFPGGFFKEADIHDALMEVSFVDRDKGRYHLREQYNAIISDLQEYFLRYDDDQQQYEFRQYAYTFCERAKATLQSFFDPTQIEIICTNLRDKLNTCNTEEKVLNWFSLEFSTFKPQLKNQLDYLDKQIDQSVAHLRENRKLSLQDGAILDTLKEIDERFEIIRSQNKELRTAFRVIGEIRQLLNTYSDQYDNDKIHNNTHSSTMYFHEMHHTLQLIDRRLDRIQPRIRQLFSNLNKPLFDIRIEKFIGYLIRNSKDAPIEGKRSLLLPEGIHQPIISGDVSDFIIVERKADLFPAKPKKRITIAENPEQRKQAFAGTFSKVVQQDRVAIWLADIADKLLTDKQIMLSDYFFKIIEKETSTQALGVAISVVYRAIKFYEQQQQYEVKINPDNNIRKPGIKTTLWEITIVQK